MKNIFIVNGSPGCGKTTFEEIAAAKLHQVYRPTLICSTIDFVKDIAKECGWDGTKTPQNRKFLSDLKDLLTEWGDVPYHKICDDLDLFYFHLDQYDVDPSCGVVFIDCREPAEIKKLCDGLGAKSILIDRKDVDEEAKTSNHADNEVYNYDYDIIIDNNGSLKDLENNVVEFLKKDLA